MYQIGQILFVVLNKKHQIFPMQVVEMVTKKTLHGEEIKYCLQAGADKSTMIMLDQLDGEIFLSSDEVRNALITRATSQIHAMILSAEKKAKEWYEKDEKISLVPDKLLEPTVTYSDAVEPVQEESTVVLPDGQVARIRLSSIKNV